MSPNETPTRMPNHETTPAEAVSAEAVSTDAVSAETATAPTSTRGPSKPVFLLISLIVLVLDQWSKWLVESNIEPFEVISVIPNLLNLTHVRNTGVAFGLFATHGDVAGTWLLSSLGLAALVFIGLYFRQVPREEKLLLGALSLVLGGAVGNLVDRVGSGGVTDFIDFFVGSYHWHTFNVADSAITVGIVFMLLASFRPTTSATPTKPNEPAR